MSKSSLESPFGGNREIAIQRDGEKCLHCGMTRAEHKEKYGYDITVDHIDGRGTRTPPEERNNALDNLQTLCSSCHGRKDRKRFVRNPASSWRREYCPNGHRQVLTNIYFHSSRSNSLECVACRRRRSKIGMSVFRAKKSLTNRGNE